MGQMQLFSNLLMIIISCNRAIGLMSRVFAKGPGDRGSIPGRIIPKAQKIVLNPTLLNTQCYKVTIMGKVEQSREWSRALPNTLVAIEKGVFRSLSSKVANFLVLLVIYNYTTQGKFLMIHKNTL